MSAADDKARYSIKLLILEFFYTDDKSQVMWSILLSVISDRISNVNIMKKKLHGTDMLVDWCKTLYI